MRVAQAMHAGVVKCRPETSLRAAARTMAAHRIHSVVIANGDSWTIISDLDVVAAACAGRLEEGRAGDTAGGTPLTIRSDETLERAAQLMHEYGESHLLVLHPHARKPIGILSTLDLAEALSDLDPSGADRVCY